MRVRSKFAELCPTFSLTDIRSSHSEAPISASKTFVYSKMMYIIFRRFPTPISVPNRGGRQTGSYVDLAIIGNCVLSIQGRDDTKAPRRRAHHRCIREPGLFP